jgi:hypothetical protein
MTIIIKANGEREPFDPNKLERSLYRSGASRETSKKITSLVQGDIKTNDTTGEIYKKAFRLLKKNNNVSAVRYSLKKAIRELGPTGYPFEYFVGRLFEVQGYNVQVGKIIKGFCVSHEVDVVADKGNEKVLVEAKFRIRPGDSVGVKVSLYMKSRFEDILKKHNEYKKSKTRCMIFTNVRFSRDATRYAHCSGSVDLVGWNYPRNKGLEKMIEQSGLHPITVLDFLSKEEKIMLLKNGLVVCQDVNKNSNRLNNINLPENKKKKIIEQSSKLCSL